MRKNPKPGVVVEIVKSGNRYNAFSSDGTKYTSYIRTGTRKGAYMAKKALECREGAGGRIYCCLLYTSPSPRDATLSRMPSSA